LSLSVGVARLGNRPHLARLLWIVLCVLLLFSGLLKVVTGNRYRVAFWAPVVLAAVLLFGTLRVTQTTVLWGVFALLVLISGLVNEKSLSNTAFAARPALIGIAFDQLVGNAIRFLSKRRLLRAMLRFGVIQLPVVLLQYGLAYGGIYQRTLWHDSFYGTFGTTDYQLAFFLNSLIILLLFSNRARRVAGRWRWPLVGICLVTLVLTNSRVNQVYGILVIGIYLTTHVRPEALVLATILVFGVALTNTVWGDLFDRLSPTALRAYFAPPSDLTWELFLQGKNQRSASVAYLLQRPLSWIGDGPGAYFTFQGGYRYGIVGTVPLYYAELGTLAVVLVIAIAWLTARPAGLIAGGKLRLNLASLLLFGLFATLSLVKDPFSDAATVLMYCLCVAMVGAPRRRGLPWIQAA